jgi:hypothetical protein
MSWGQPSISENLEDGAATLQPAVTLKEFGQCRQYARRLASMRAHDAPALCSVCERGAQKGE